MSKKRFLVYLQDEDSFWEVSHKDAWTVFLILELMGVKDFCITQID